MEVSTRIEATVADAVPGNWVDWWAPLSLRGYLRLARLDRPTGIWLLLWPCWWSIALAAPTVGPLGLSDLRYLLLFGAGAVVMRGAGCTLNDIVDRSFDAQVPRTKMRPIPSGSVSVPAACGFLLIQLVVAHLILFSLNSFAIVLGASSELLVLFYPFAKRITNWPQLVLGVTFNWGALLGWAAVTGQLSPPPVLLYIAGIFWTLGYDTIYAHQDRRADPSAGVKSSAVKLGSATARWLCFFYAGTLVFLGAAAVIANLGWVFFLGLGLAAIHLGWQIAALQINDPARCLSLFRANVSFGAIVFVAICAGVGTT
jgi:4-hydroxybenzoate polyprenyltransferase